MNKLLAERLQQLKGWLASLSPWALVALALAVPLAVLAFKWLQGWYARRKQQRAAAAPAPAPPRTDRLLRAWRQFLKQLYPLWRRSIFQFQPFLVLGDAGSGKSHLIDSYTDWRQQERQQLGGALDDPDLRLCLGSRGLFLELSARVLLDTSRQGREALLRLGRPLLRRRPPVVVLALDAVALAATSVETARGFADTVRGKLNLLAQASRQPSEVRLVLTHLEQVKGYEAFSSFLARQHIPATLPLRREDWESEAHLERALLRRLAEWERLLPLALTTLPASDYLRVTVFLERVRPYLSRVSHFLAALGAHNPLAPTPRLERLYLAALHTEGEGANPFHATAEASRIPDPLWRHRLAAVACAALGALYLLTGYLYERTLWNPARAAVLQYQERLTNDGERVLRQRIAAFLERRRHVPMRYLPGFFSQDEALEARLSEGLREHYLLPALKQLPGRDEPYRRGLYLLALLYATRDNALGQLVQANVSHWREATELDEELVKAYVRSTAQPYDKSPPLPPLPPPGPPDATNDAQRWQAFFQRLENALEDKDEGRSLSSQELADLREEAGRLRAGLRIIRRFEKTKLLLKELEQSTDPKLRGTYKPAEASVSAPELFGDTLPTVERLLDLVSGQALEAESSNVRLLSAFNERLQALQEGAQEPEERTFFVRMPAQSLTLQFQVQQWESLIRASAMHELVQRFLDPSQKRTSIFFSGEEQLNGLQMSPEAQGFTLFTWVANVPGPYTRGAWEQHVLPALERYIGLEKALTPQDRDEMKRFIEGQVQRYADEYQAQMTRYYQSFQVSVSSQEELQLLLKQLFDPGSPFTELLSTVNHQTALEVDEARVPVARPMRAVRERYAPLHKVMAEQKPGVSGLQPYRDLLEQIRQHLEVKSDEPQDKPAEAALLDGLRPQLSPVGRMTLDILREEKGSYRVQLWKWLTSVGLSKGLAGPFAAPLVALSNVGEENLGVKATEAWDQHLLASLSDVQRSFPFKRGVVEPEVTFQQMEELFHPLKGRFHLLFKQYLDPISQCQDGGDCQPLQELASRVPPDLYPTVNNARRLTRRLWDREGNPQHLRLTITPVPFNSGTGRGPFITLAYLHSGTEAMLNFNQLPEGRKLAMDWTQPREARLSIELFNRDTNSKAYPTALLGKTSHWSLLHLLRSASSRQGDTWSWSFPAGSAGKEELRVTVQFRLQEDPWSLFVLRPEPAGALSSPSPP